MPHLDKKKPELGKVIPKQDSKEMERVTSLTLFYIFCDGPQERFEFQLYPFSFPICRTQPKSVAAPKRFKAIRSGTAL